MELIPVNLTHAPFRGKSENYDQITLSDIPPLYTGTSTVVCTWRNFPSKSSANNNTSNSIREGRASRLTYLQSLLIPPPFFPPEGSHSLSTCETSSIEFLLINLPPFAT